MPKIKLTALSDEYEVTFEEAIGVVLEKIPEEYITGRGKNLSLIHISEPTRPY